MENLFVKEEVYQEIKRKMNKKDDYFTEQEMAEYTKQLQEFLGTKRNFSKTMFKITSKLTKGHTENNRYII